MNTICRGRFVPLALGIVTAAGWTVSTGLGAGVAEAASVTAAPIEAWTTVATPLPFSGTDPVTLSSRSLAITFGGDDATCVVNVPQTDDYDGDCAGVHLAVTPGMGVLTIDDSALAYVGAGRSGEADFTVTGPIAALEAALASVVYTPPAAFSTEGGAPVPFTVEGYDAGGGGLSTRKVAIHVTDNLGVTDDWFTAVPKHVYTPKGVAVAFTPDADPVTGLPRSINIDPPFDSSGCTYAPATMQGSGTCLVAYVSIVPAGTDDRGTLMVGADTSGFAFNPLGIAGSFMVVATEDQVQSVLSSLSYLPPDANYVTPADNPVPIEITLYEANVVPDTPLPDPNPILEHTELVYVHILDAIEDPCPDEPEPTTTTMPEETTTTTVWEETTTTTVWEDTTTTTMPEETTTTTEDPQRPERTTTTTSIFVITIPEVTRPPLTLVEVTVPVTVGPVINPPVVRPIGFRSPSLPMPECPGDNPGGDTPGGDTPGGDTPGGETPGGDPTGWSLPATR